MTEMTQQQAFEFLLRQVYDTRTHVEASSRVLRYNLWQQLKKDLPDSDVAKYGFRVYSQNDQDGILEYIFKYLEIECGIAIEFGCDNGVENCTHYLLTKGWTCVWADVIESHLEYIRNNFKSYIDSDKLFVMKKFIDKDNINDVFKLYNNFIDLMVIDTDWNEYYLFEALKLNPKVICIEYNAHIPPPTKLTVPYNPEHKYLWDGSNCFGASFQALYDLGKSKGYQCVGCSIAGADMFFVRNDLVDKLWLNGYVHLYDERLYKPPRFNLEFNLGHQSSPGNWVKL
jgi:hypothetical protein